MGTRFQSKTRDGTSPLGHIVGPSEYTSAGLFSDSTGRPRLQNAAAAIVLGADSVSWRGVTYVKFALTAAATGKQGSLLNSTAACLGVDCYVVDAFIDITTASTGAGTINMGVAGTDTSNDVLIDGASVATIATINTKKNAGTNGGTSPKLAAGSYITVYRDTGDPTGMVATAYVGLVPVF